MQKISKYYKINKILWGNKMKKLLLILFPALLFGVNANASLSTAQPILTPLSERYDLQTSITSGKTQEKVEDSAGADESAKKGVHATQVELSDKIREKLQELENVIDEDAKKNVSDVSETMIDIRERIVARRVDNAKSNLEKAVKKYEMERQDLEDIRAKVEEIRKRTEKK
jgi:hypothetical protein